MPRVQAVVNVDDYGASAQALAATTLRNVLGTRSLGEILSDRVQIATEIYEMLVEGTQGRCGSSPILTLVYIDIQNIWWCRCHLVLLKALSHLRNGRYNTLLLPELGMLV